MTQLNEVCACKDCQCKADSKFEQNDQSYCSEACANGHANGAGCCGESCKCCG